MAYVAMTTMVFGVVLSALAGILCCMGSGSVGTSLDWLPHADLLLSQPHSVLCAGVVMIVLSLIFQPSRVD